MFPEPLQSDSLNKNADFIFDELYIPISKWVNSKSPSGVTVKIQLLIRIPDDNWDIISPYLYFICHDDLNKEDELLNHPNINWIYFSSSMSDTLLKNTLIYNPYYIFICDVYKKNHMGKNVTFFAIFQP